MVHPNRKRLTPEQAALVIEQARAGIPYGEIAERVGVTLSAVQARAAKAGIRRMPSSGGLPTTSIVRAVEISRQLRCANSTVLKVLRVYGATIRVGGNRPRVTSAEIIRLRERHGLTFRQIGDRYRLTASTVGIRYRRAKRHMVTA